MIMQSKLYAYPGNKDCPHFIFFSGTWASWRFLLFDLLSDQKRTTNLLLMDLRLARPR